MTIMLAILWWTACSPSPAPPSKASLHPVTPDQDAPDRIVTAVTTPDAALAAVPGPPQERREEPAEAGGSDVGVVADRPAQPGEDTSGPVVERDAATFVVSARGLRQVAQWRIDAAEDGESELAQQPAAESAAALLSGETLDDVLRGQRLAPIDVIAWAAAQSRRGDRVVVAVFGVDTEAEWEAQHEAAGDLERERRRLRRRIERCLEQRRTERGCDDSCGEEAPDSSCADEVLPYKASRRSLHVARVSAPAHGHAHLDAAAEIGDTFSGYSYPRGVVRAIEIADLDGDGTAEAAVRYATETTPYCPCGTDIQETLVVLDLGTWRTQAAVNLGFVPGCTLPPVASIHSFRDEGADGTTDLVVRWAYYSWTCNVDERGWPSGRRVSTQREVNDIVYRAQSDPALRVATAIDVPPCVFAVERLVLTYDPARDAWGPGSNGPIPSPFR